MMYFIYLFLYETRFYYKAVAGLVLAMQTWPDSIHLPLLSQGWV